MMDGRSIPQLGLGTYQAIPDLDILKTVTAALSSVIDILILRKCITMKVLSAKAFAKGVYLSTISLSPAKFGPPILAKTKLSLLVKTAWLVLAWIIWIYASYIGRKAGAIFKVGKP